MAVNPYIFFLSRYSCRTPRIDGLILYMEILGNWHEFRHCILNEKQSVWVFSVFWRPLMQEKNYCWNRKIQRRFILRVESEVPKVTADRKRIFEVLEVTPEVRKDKIALLKKSIEEGTYRVKADDIAEKMIKNMLSELPLGLNDHGHRRARSN